MFNIFIDSLSHIYAWLYTMVITMTTHITARIRTTCIWHYLYIECDIITSHLFSRKLFYIQKLFFEPCKLNFEFMSISEVVSRFLSIPKMVENKIGQLHSLLCFSLLVCAYEIRLDRSRKQCVFICDIG